MRILIAGMDGCLGGSPEWQRTAKGEEGAGADLGCWDRPAPRTPRRGDAPVSGYPRPCAVGRLS